MLSTIYSKKYLNLSNDPHSLAFVTFVYPFLFKLLRQHGCNEAFKLISVKSYFCLGLFNIGTILLTNIGMSETTVSLTYMVKVGATNLNKKIQDNKTLF
jgi:hypothetical protein